MNANKPIIVDILMATYNGELFLKEQLDSIINQSYVDWNLLIRDDGSVDGTVELLERYKNNDSRIKLLKDDLGNVGLVRNFEILMCVSSAEYIMLVDQDDVWFSDKISRCMKLMLAREDYSKTPLLIVSNSIITDEYLHPKRLLYSKKYSPSLSNFLFYNAGLQGAAMLMNRSLLDCILPIPKNVLVHDYHISICAFVYGEVFFIPTPLAFYRRHSNAATLNRSMLKSIFYRIKSFKNTLYQKKTVSYLNDFIVENRSRITDNTLKILEAYLDIYISKSFFYCIKLIEANDFTLRGSKMYLILKLLMCKLILRVEEK